jgi:hypothetical protein
MIYYHVDVFSSEILSGNGLTVIFHEEDMSMLILLMNWALLLIVNIMNTIKMCGRTY